MKKNADRGVTLIEIAVSSAVLAIMIAFVMMVFFNANTSSRNTSVQSDLAGRGRQTLERIRADLSLARLNILSGSGSAIPGVTGGIYGSHTIVRYQLPVFTMNDGTFVYGATAGQGQSAPLLGGFYELMFVGDTVIRESGGVAPNAAAAYPPPSLPVDPLYVGPWLPAGIEVIDSARDLNGDGDQTDTFVRGRLILRTFRSDPVVALDSAAAIDDYVLLRVKPDLISLDGGIVRDTDSDPLFVLTNSSGIEINNDEVSITTSARKVAVKLWHGHFDAQERRFLQFKNEEEIRLENPQADVQ